MQPDMKRTGENAYFAASNSRNGFHSYYEHCFRHRVDHLYCIKGGPGTGKSTLMHILGCLDRPTVGSYKLDGQEVAGLSDDKLAITRNKKIGFVFQNYNLIPHQTVLGNVELALTIAGMGRAERIEKAKAALTELSGLREEHPLFQLILHYYCMLFEGCSIFKLMAEAEKQKHTAMGAVV